MALPGLEILRVVPDRQRPPQANIPQSLAERERLRAAIARYVASHRERLVPPLVLDELKTHAGAVVAETGVNPIYVDYVGVLLSNEVWREQLATVPYERRLLLLPKCLRVEDKCPAPFDEFGLLCKQCGLCTIQDLQNEAERLGYAVLVAEGSAIVMSLIQTGKIDAIVGVSCLSVLERAFPYMEAAAVPGVAIPLLQDDCKDTTVDLDWVWDVIHLSAEDRTRRMDLDGMRAEVGEWFEPAALERLLGAPAGAADRIARDWLARAGKRWRPFLTACAYRAFQDDPSAALPDDVKRVAVAVECFHKASLIHDDIEDGDAHRYGAAALHIEHGVPVALNVGDLLIGEGYRLLAQCEATAAVRGQLIAIAAEGHRQLCLGQGAELDWARTPRVLGSSDVLEIFRRKTSPAFEVALRVGAALAGAPQEVHATLTRYSDALGIAYQIRDDIEDVPQTDAAGEARAEALGHQLSDPVAQGSRPADPVAQGFSTADSVAQGSSPTAPVAQGVNPVAQGFSRIDPVAQGSSPIDPVAQGSRPADPVAQGFSTADSVAQGFSTADSVAQGVNPVAQGFSPVDSVAQGFSPVDTPSLPIVIARERSIPQAQAVERCRTLMEMYKEQAIQTLLDVQNPSLKGLLRRVVGKIFRVEIKGWCSEFEARNAAGRQAGAQAAG